MNRIALLAVVSCLGLVALLDDTANPLAAQRPNQVADFMRAKLDHSQRVLEGLTVEDFGMIAKNSQDMALLSQATNWQVLQTEEYLQQSGEFRRAANTLTQAARDKNLDAAALAYVDLTMKCINCHKYVRGVRLARLP